MTALSFESVAVELGGRTVLEDIGLRVEAGEPLGVTGPSGAGKTALCLLAAGVVAPERGRVLLERGPTPGAGGPASGEVALVLQTHGLVDGLTAEETVALPLEARGVPRDEVARRAADALGSVGLTEHAQRFVEDLSGGERQRVGIARALAQDPVVLVADEPTAELDPDNRGRVLELLLAFAARGGVLIVASDDDEVIGACTHAVRLEDGRVAAALG